MQGDSPERKERVMVELLEKMVMTGLGALSLSKGKAEELLAEVREKYRLTEEEGKVFLDKLLDLAQQGRENIVETAESEVKKAVRAAGMVTREEYGRLEQRVAELERRLSLLAESNDPEE